LLIKKCSNYQNCFILATELALKGCADMRCRTNSHGLYYCEVCLRVPYHAAHDYKRCTCSTNSPEQRDPCDCCKICKYITTELTGDYCGYADDCEGCGESVFHTFAKPIKNHDLPGESRVVKLADTSIRDLHTRVKFLGYDIEEKPIGAIDFSNELWHRLQKVKEEQDTDKEKKEEQDLLECFAALMSCHDTKPLSL
jgi:hypothetical protein